MPHPEDLISTTESAAIVGVNTSRMRQFARQCRLPAMEVGFSWVFRRGDVEDFAKVGRPHGRPKENKK